MLKRRGIVQTTFSVLLALSLTTASAQDNSPYSRYGLGDVVPNTNILNRAMGGISAGYSDFLSINFNNPASYSRFQAIPEANSKRLQSGRVVLDGGLNIENRTLRTPNATEKFSSTGAQFSYLQVGLPLRKNWGLSFGLRPLTRVNYDISRAEYLKDPITGDSIELALSEFTGFAIKNFSVGVNVGYLFGRRETTNNRSLFNDSLLYNRGRFLTNTYYGDVFVNAGVQYQIDITKQTVLRLGASGNMERKLSATQDIIRETYIEDPNGGDFTQDSVRTVSEVKGEVVYPASYTAGFVVEHQKPLGSGWLLGVDFVQTQWSDFRFMGAQDAVKDNWQVRLGGQFRGKPGRNYFSNVAYRAGFYTGQDYVTAGGDLPNWGITVGAGLPIANYNRLAPGQFSVINLALEYNKRGNNDNIVKENTFRFSLGLNFSDLWFNKRKYD
jgi:hypothetical protein